MQLIKVITYFVAITALCWVGYSTIKNFNSIKKFEVEEIPHVFDFTIVNECPPNPYDYKQLLNFKGDTFILIGPLNQDLSCGEALKDNSPSENIKIQKVTLNPKEFGMPLVSNSPTLDLFYAARNQLKIL